MGRTVTRRYCDRPDHGVDASPNHKPTTAQMKIELVVVDGDAGRRLHKRQSAAVLKQLACQRQPPDDPHRHPIDRRPCKPRNSGRNNPAGRTQEQLRPRATAATTCRPAPRTSDRGWSCRVPMLYGTRRAHPTGQHTNPQPVIEGPELAVSAVHAKVRRDGYRPRGRRIVDSAIDLATIGVDDRLPAGRYARDVSSRGVS